MNVRDCTTKATGRNWRQAMTTGSVDHRYPFGPYSSQQVQLDLRLRLL
ncbi:tetratricopeptide repeat protein [Shigella flexneri]